MSDRRIQIHFHQVVDHAASQLIAILTITAAVLAASGAYAARADRELCWFYLGLTYLL